MLLQPPLAGTARQLPASAPQPAPPALLLASPGCSPSLYWLGPLKGGLPGAGPGCFDMAAAEGPLALDLGDLLYAPNVLRVGAG